LCGARGGGPIDPFALGSGMAGTDSLVNLADYDEWFAGCSHNNDGRLYSFGSTLGPNTCNGPSSGSSGPVDVGSDSTCVGGYPGLFDMSGNVWEWENACTGDNVDAGAGTEGGVISDAGPPNTTPCRARGGSYTGNNVDLYCRLSQSDTLLSYGRAETHPEVGFRCCSD